MSATNPKDEGRSVTHTTQACDACRARKVRCDGQVGGTSCTNCSRGQVACLFNGLDRRRPQDRQTAAQQYGYANQNPGMNMTGQSLSDSSSSPVSGRSSGSPPYGQGLPQPMIGGNYNAAQYGNNQMPQGYGAPVNPQNAQNAQWQAQQQQQFYAQGGPGQPGFPQQGTPQGRGQPQVNPHLFTGTAFPPPGWFQGEGSDPRQGGSQGGYQGGNQYNGGRR